jgi:molybdopterin-binding protein
MPRQLVGDARRHTQIDEQLVAVAGDRLDPPPMVEISLDAGGETLVASITEGAVRALALEPGLPVTALIKSAAFDRMSLGPAETGKPQGSADDD